MPSPKVGVEDDRGCREPSIVSELRRFLGLEGSSWSDPHVPGFVGAKAEMDRMASGTTTSNDA
jgi:hypothetical protein